MDKQAFSDLVKGLALLTDHQRVMLAQVLAACDASAVTRQLGTIAERPVVCQHCQASAASLPPWGQAMAYHVTGVMPVAEPAIH